jgi:serine phosphatase RsbU (regulator of sigma subunit)
MAERERDNLFQSEYEREMEAWLRRRFRYLCATYLGLSGLALLWLTVWGLPDQAGSPTALWIIALGHIARLAVIAWFLFGRSWAAASREEMLRGATWMIIIVGTISLLGVLTIRQMNPELAPGVLLSLFLWHLTACLFLPWTPRESLRPFVPLFIAWVLIRLLSPTESGLLTAVLDVIFAPAVFLPGLAIAAYRIRRHSEEFQTRMVGQQFWSMRREFGRARQIHESMFPKPYDDGHVLFEYDYTPMREIGGDFVHLHVSPGGLLHLTLLDVTGHGLAAALTVNQLYGELERIRAELPNAEPKEVVRLLNRYFHLTLSRHNIYATAACVEIDPYLARARWSSAGHPPGYLRGVNGIITDLSATAVLLGAHDPDEFDAGQEATDLTPGDTLLFYTDGVFESRDRLGRQFGLPRLRDLIHIQPPPRSWPRFIASAVSRHSLDRSEDDVLIASIVFRKARRERSPAREEEVAAVRVPSDSA